MSVNPCTKLHQFTRHLFDAIHTQRIYIDIQIRWITFNIRTAVCLKLTYWVANTESGLGQSFELFADGWCWRTPRVTSTCTNKLSRSNVSAPELETMNLNNITVTYINMMKCNLVGQMCLQLNLNWTWTMKNICYQHLSPVKFNALLQAIGWGNQLQCQMKWNIKDFNQGKQMLVKTGGCRRPARGFFYHKNLFNKSWSYCTITTLLAFLMWGGCKTHLWDADCR